MPLETGRAGAGIAGVKQLGEVSPNFETIINLCCNVARVLSGRDTLGSINSARPTYMVY